MKKHYVTFYSPGTFVSEQQTQEVDSWDVVAAQDQAKHITERHNAIPFGFRFTTRERTDEDFDSKEVARSCMYYVNCKVETLAEIEARNDSSDKILISNMKCNDWDRVAVTVTGWKNTHPLQGDDIVLYD